MREVLNLNTIPSFNELGYSIKDSNYRYLLVEDKEGNNYTYYMLSTNKEIREESEIRNGEDFYKLLARESL